MKKLLYITVLTAFALFCVLPNAVDLNLVWLGLIWLADIAVLFAGELVGTLVGRRSAFGEKWGANIGAGISSVVILAVYVFIALNNPEELRERAWRVLYYPIGAACVISLIINVGNIAAKKIVTFRARHGAPPSEDLTLKKFLPRLFIMAGTGILNAALILIFFALAQYEMPAVRLLVNVVGMALKIQIALVIGLFVDRLAEKRIADNILVAAAAVLGIVLQARYILDFQHYLNGHYFPEPRESDLVVAWIMLGLRVAVLIADIAWAVLKIRKGKVKKGALA